MSERQDLHARACCALAEVSSLVPYRRELRQRLRRLRDDQDRWENAHPDASYSDNPYRDEISQLDRQGDDSNDDFYDALLIAIGTALVALSSPVSGVAGNPDKDGNE